MNNQIDLFNNRNLLTKGKTNRIIVLSPLDVLESTMLLKSLEIKPTVTILDPWYNKGVGGVRSDYVQFITTVLKEVGEISKHVFLWGFPEMVALFVDKIPSSLKFTCWLTWYYKNNPSVIKGWRSSQQACLHLSKPDAKLYPEHFFNGDQRMRYDNNKMRFIPGPPSVLEESLIVGFVGKKERTGHPSQKPVKLFEKLLLMTAEEGDLVFDPMCGSGTTAEACKNLNLSCIISDISDEYVTQSEKRLSIKRMKINNLKKVAHNKTLLNKKYLIPT